MASMIPAGSSGFNGIGSQPSLTALKACSNRSSHSLRKLTISLPRGRRAGSGPAKVARRAARSSASSASGSIHDFFSAPSSAAGGAMRGRVKTSSA